MKGTMSHPVFNSEPYRKAMIADMDKNDMTGLHTDRHKEISDENRAFIMSAFEDYRDGLRAATWHLYMVLSLNTSSTGREILERKFGLGCNDVNEICGESSLWPEYFASL